MRFLSYLVYILPTPLKSFIGLCIGVAWFDILRLRRGLAIRQVQRVYPDKSHRDCVRMARASLIHLAYNIVEVFTLYHLKKEELLEQYPIIDRQHLDKAFEKGTGVFLITGHVGNGDLATAALSHAGYKCHLISKEFKSGWLNRFWFESRERHGTKYIPPRRSSYEILKALKKNEMVIFVFDQYTGPPNGIVTEFFGYKTGTASGLALLAERAGAIVVPAHTYRDGLGNNTIEVVPPVELETSLSKEENVQVNTQRLSDAIEKMILDKPEQWMWVHKRWKGAWTTDEQGVHHLIPETILK